MRIIVLGTGGTGGFFGAKLARSGEDVTFVARGEHLRALREQGLHIRSATEGDWSLPVNAVDQLTKHGIADLVLFCVKSFDTDAAAELAKPVIGPETAVLSIQNGVDSEERITRIIGPGHVMGGVAYVFAHIESPGVIGHRQLGRIIFGEMNGEKSKRAERILGALQKAGIPAEIAPHIRKTLWEKFLCIAPVAGTTAVMRLPAKFIHEIPEVRKLWEMQLDELLALARAAGAGLDAGVKQRSTAFMESLAPTTASSLCQDLLAGKRLELEAFHGHAVRLGERAGIPTPVLLAVYAALKPWINGPPQPAGE